LKPLTGLIALCLATLFVAPSYADEPQTPAAPAVSTEPTPAAAPAKPVAGTERKHLDVKQLFATLCGWCHSDGGRAEGKGPQLMNTKRDDDYIRNRIIFGKEGKMPSFGGSFSLEDIDDIIAYIRTLKPE
jgi:mono/diheme cytochrome c family protein